jgi:O-methyltransferase involved in polyketide biosynthesis
METKIKIDLGNIQKTLFMPVWARAVETKKNKPVLTDFTAVEIIDSVDFDFSQMSKNLKEINQISWIARCKRFDSIIRDFIKNNPEGTIVNIGCGLDTTYERIGDQSIMWYDLDLPDVIELRKKFLKETGKRKFIAGSFLDTAWFDEISAKNRILFISAGVFVYFEEPEIKNFIILLADKFDDSELFFDVTSLKGMQIANKVIRDAGLDSNSFFKWGLSDKSIIASWDNRIKLINTYYTFNIKGLGLSLKNRIIGFLSDSAGVQYMVHLRIMNKTWESEEK